jgi:hypothetical protein
MLQFRIHPPAMSRRGTLPESSFIAKRFLFNFIPAIRSAFRRQSDTAEATDAFDRPRARWTRHRPVSSGSLRLG